MRTEKKLQAELGRLRRLLDLPELQVKWMPGHARYLKGRPLSGEVVSNTIFIYDDREDTALKTLLHEVLEKFIVESSENDYVILVNNLIEAFNEIQRRRRHGLVEKITKLIDHPRCGEVEDQI